MAAQKLPFLFGIPHGAVNVPAPLAGRILASEEQLRCHGDIATETIYDLPVLAKVVAKTHRYACDVNRDPEARGETSPIPELDFDQQPLYRPGEAPTEAERRQLLQAFHSPYHAALGAARQDEDVLYHFECHSMEAIPPPRSPDRSRYERSDRYRRPAVCLANLGDADGGPGKEKFTSCPREDLVTLARLFEAEGFETLLNNPFRDGYALRAHGRRWYAGLERVPVIQLELAQDQWLTGPRGSYDPVQGAAVRERLFRVLQAFADSLTQSRVSL